MSMLNIDPAHLAAQRDEARAAEWARLQSESSLPADERRRLRQSRADTRARQIIDELPAQLDAATKDGLNYVIVFRLEQIGVHSPYVHSIAKALDEDRFEINALTGETLQKLLAEQPQTAFSRLSFGTGAGLIGYALVAYLK